MRYLLAVPGLKGRPDMLARTGMHHRAFEYGRCGSSWSRPKTARRRGHHPARQSRSREDGVFYYDDPDADSVELQADYFGDWKQSTKIHARVPGLCSRRDWRQRPPAMDRAEFVAAAEAVQISERRSMVAVDPG
jgi:hypothetical protein